jgi:hypothetical protein
VLRVCDRALQEVLVSILQLEGNISCVGTINIRNDMCWRHEIDVVRICINKDIIYVIVQIQVRLIPVLPSNYIDP